MQKIFAFPNPVNETSSRIVAAGVALTALTIITLNQHWLLIPLAYGFAARVTTGPRFSPLALLATKIITPHLKIKEKLVPGPPKRFAQAIGATLATAALLSHYNLNNGPLTTTLLAALTIAATLEATLGICFGCIIFNKLIKLKLIPEKICIECANITNRAPQQTK